MTSDSAIPAWRLTRPQVACAAAVAVSVLWFGAGLAGPVPPLIGWLLLAVAIPVTAAVVWRAGHRGRTFWRFVSAGIVLVGVGAASSAYDYFGSVRYAQHVSTRTSVIYVLGLMVMLAGLIRIPGARRTRVEWTRFGLDIATILVTVLTVTVHLLLPQWEQWSAGGVRDGWEALTVVGGGFVCVFAFVKVAFTGTGPVDRRALHLLALAGAVGAGGGALAPLLASRPYLNAGHLVLPVTCLVLCLAADRQLRVTAAGLPAPRPHAPGWSMMPYAAVAFTGALLLYSAVRHDDDILVVALGAVTVTMLVTARQVVVLRDNAALVDRLDTRQRQLTHQATHDTLTGLANRGVLMRDTAAALADDGSYVGVALIDLDDFKAINDDLGHAVGDALLVAVARRLGTHVPPDGTVARLGGDEYALLLRRDHEATIAAITAHLRTPVPAADHALIVEASIGLALARPGDDAPELLRRADVAMYAAKSRGKGRYVVYHADLDRQSAEQSLLAADLRSALDAGRLHLCYQPIVSLADRAVAGVEALARWDHPRRGPIGPATFIPAAERTGLIVPLGAWILDQACRQAVRWRAELGADAPATMSVNVSARQLREADFAAEVAAVLDRTGMPPQCLIVEVTETAVFDDGTALAALRDLDRLGVMIALDDFGTGHSSLSLLRNSPARILKVDKSFVDDITEGGEHAVVAAALIHICDGLGLRAVAEGVENARQADELARLGYRYAQGFHYGQPVPAAELERGLRGRRTGLVNTR